MYFFYTENENLNCKEQKIIHLFILKFHIHKKKWAQCKPNFFTDYGKGRYISDECLWCSANHNALSQLANQSRLCLSEGGTSTQSHPNSSHRTVLASLFDTQGTPLVSLFDVKGPPFFK